MNNNRRCNFCGQGWVLPVEEELECGRHDIERFDFPIVAVFAVLGVVIAGGIGAVIFFRTRLPEPELDSLPVPPKPRFRLPLGYGIGGYGLGV